MITYVPIYSEYSLEQLAAGNLPTLEQQYFKYEPYKLRYRIGEAPEEGEEVVDY